MVTNFVTRYLTQWGRKSGSYGSIPDNIGRGDRSGAGTQEDQYVQRKERNPQSFHPENEQGLNSVYSTLQGNLSKLEQNLSRLLFHFLGKEKDRNVVINILYATVEDTTHFTNRRWFSNELALWCNLEIYPHHLEFYSSSHLKGQKVSGPWKSLDFVPGPFRIL